MAFRLTIEIAAPPSAVFAVVADPLTMPRWYSAVQSVQLVEGSGRGARYLVDRRLPTGTVRNEVQIASYLPHAEVTLHSIAGPTPFTYRYRLSPGPRGTTLRLDGTISGAGLPGPAALLGPVAERAFERGMRDNLAQLARIVESA